MATEGDSQGTILRLREDALAWRFVGDEVIALDVERSAYLGVNPTGSLLWAALGAGATSGDLVSLVVQRFGLDEQEATGHVRAFIADLSGRGLLEEIAAP